MLITSAGQRVSLVRAFQRELKAKWPEGRVLTVDMNPRLSAACNASDGYFTVPPVKDERYVETLAEICVRENVRMLIPTIDTELPILAQSKARLAEIGAAAIVSTSEFVGMCRDKRLSNEFFSARGFRTPRPIDKRAPTFPLFIKPYDGSLSADTYVIRAAEQLTPKHLSNERFLFMEYVDPAQFDEFTIDLYVGRDEQLKCVVPRQRLQVRAGEISKGVTSRNTLVELVRERCAHIPGAVGCLTLQVFLCKTTGGVIASELNARFGGGFPLSYAAGANYPKWLLEEHLEGRSLNWFADWEPDLLMLRYDDEVLVHDYRTHA